MSSDSSLPQLLAEVVPLTALRPSPTNPRKFFDHKSLGELAASIKEHGILEPLLVRKDGGPPSEIVCGERRFRAAKIAALAEVPVVFREFTDEDVKIIQLVENGQREDLSPIEEAETYAELAARGMTIAEIAKKLSREKRAIARRLPLAKLPQRIKGAMASGLLPTEHAELIARIPDAKLQDAALSRILKDSYVDDKPVRHVAPYAVAKRIIENEFMAALAVAVFDPEDVTLSPLGQCSKCPHLAGNSPDLFGDVKSKAVCTNPKDFRLKSENHLSRLRESGYTVLLMPKELTRAFPQKGSDQTSREFVDLEDTCFADPKKRSYEELLGRAEKLKTVFALKDGRVRRLYPAKAIKEALAAAGHAFAKEKKKRTVGKTEAARSAAQLERLGEEAVSRELAARLRTVKLSPGGWLDLILQIVMLESHWKVERVVRRHGFEGNAEEFAHKRDEILKRVTEGMSDAAKRAFLVDLLMGDWITTQEKPLREFYRHVLKLANIDYAKVANKAIDHAKRDAIRAKDTPKPPIAAKVVRGKEVKRKK
jgi:ParB/RepB/Spo0J family partition protein